MVVILSLWHSPTPPHSTGLAGSNDIENAKIWGAIDAASDLWEKMVQAHFEKDEKRKVILVEGWGQWAGSVTRCICATYYTYRVLMSAEYATVVPFCSRRR